MLTQNEITALSLSPTKKDFVQIWNELLEVAGKLSERWDPTSTNESDPGIVLLKVLTGIADKLNYNIDKNILEAFMPTAAQEDSMRKLCDMLGYNMKYYRSAETEVTIKYYNPDPSDEEAEAMTVPGQLIPKFTVITNSDKDISYFTTNETAQYLSSAAPSLTLPCMEGQIVKCESNNNNNVITVNQISENNRFYLPETMVAENGIFIYNVVADSSTLADGERWTKVDNLNVQARDSKVFKFGYDSYESRPYVEFPEDYSKLFNEGIFLYYARTSGVNGNVSPRTLTQLELPTTGNWSNVSVESLSIENVFAATSGANAETIKQAYNNFKKTIGTFETLVTCRDYMNKIYSFIENGKPVVSNILVTDIRNDLNKAITICSCDSDGIFYKDVPVSSNIPVYENTKPVFSAGKWHLGDASGIILSNFVNDTSFDAEKNGEVFVKEGYWAIKQNDTVYKTGLAIGVTEQAIDHFDIVLYPFKYYNQIKSNIKDIRATYDASFEYSERNKGTITNLLDVEETKTISHNIKYPDVGDVLSINNYLRLSATIATNAKVTADESTIIIDNIKKALANAFNMRELDFGDTIPFDSIVEVIEGADQRIKVASLNEPALYTTFSVLEGRDNNTPVIAEYAVASDWLDADIADSTGRFDMKDIVRDEATGKIISFSSNTFDSKAARKIYNKLAVRNILAGRVPLFNYNTSFASSFYESAYQITDIISSSETPTGLAKPEPENPFTIWTENNTIYTGQYEEKEENKPIYTYTKTTAVYPDNVITEAKNGNIVDNYITDVKAECRLLADDDGIVTDVALADGEFVKFRAPNFKTIKTYPAYVNYYLDLNKELHTDSSPAIATSLFDILDNDRINWLADATNIKWQKVLDYFTHLDAGLNSSYKKTFTLSLPVSAFITSDSSDANITYGDSSITIGVGVNNTPIEKTEYTPESLFLTSGCVKWLADGFRARVEWTPTTQEEEANKPSGDVPLNLVLEDFTNPFITSVNTIADMKLGIETALATYKSALPPECTKCSFTVYLDFECVPFEAKSLTAWEGFIKSCVDNFNNTSFAYQVLDYVPYSEYNAIFWRLFGDGYDIGRYVTQDTEKLLKFSKNYFGLLSNNTNYLQGIYLIESVGSDAKPVIINNNEEYRLDKGEFLYIEYTPSTTTEEGTSKNLAAITEIYGEGTIIRPSGFEVGIMDSSIFESSGNSHSKEVTFSTATGNAVTKNMHSFGASEQVEIRDFAQVTLSNNDFPVVYIYKNFNGCPELESTTGNDEGLRKYTLKDGEAIFYTDQNQAELAYFTAGTEVELTGNVTIGQFDIIELSTILDSGIQAIPWEEARQNLFEGDKIIFQEYQYITLGKEDTIKKLELLDSDSNPLEKYVTSDCHVKVCLNDAWKYCTNAVYTIAGDPDTEITLPVINLHENTNGNGWEVSSTLELNVSSSISQTIRSTDKVATSLILARTSTAGGSAGEDVLLPQTGHYPTELPLAFKTNLACQACGNEINIDDVWLNTDNLKGFQLKVYAQDAPVTVKTRPGEVVPYDYTGDIIAWQGKALEDKEYLELWNQVNLKEIKGTIDGDSGAEYDNALRLPISLLPNTYGVFCIYIDYTSTAATSTAKTWIEAIPGTDVGDITLLNESNPVVEYLDGTNKKKLKRLYLNSGVNCIRVNKTGRIFIKTSADAQGILYFDELSLVNSLPIKYTDANKTTVTLNTQGLNLTQLGYLDASDLDDSRLDATTKAKLQKAYVDEMYSEINVIRQSTDEEFTVGYNEIVKLLPKVQWLVETEAQIASELADIKGIDEERLAALTAKYKEVKDTLEKERSLLAALNNNVKADELEQSLITLLDSFNSIESAQQQLLGELAELTGAAEKRLKSISNKDILKDFAESNETERKKALSEIKTLASSKIEEYYQEQLTAVTNSLNASVNSASKNTLLNILESLKAKTTSAIRAELQIKVSELSALVENEIAGTLSELVTATYQEDGPDYARILTLLTQLKSTFSSTDLKALVSEMAQAVSSSNDAQLKIILDDIRLLTNITPTPNQNNTEVIDAIDAVYNIAVVDVHPNKVGETKSKLETLRSKIDENYTSKLTGLINAIGTKLKTLENETKSIDAILSTLTDLEYNESDTDSKSQVQQVINQLNSIIAERNKFISGDTAEGIYGINDITAATITSWKDNAASDFIKESILAVWPSFINSRLALLLADIDKVFSDTFEEKSLKVDIENLTKIYSSETAIMKQLLDIKAFIALFDKFSSLLAVSEQASADTKLVSEVSGLLLDSAKLSDASVAFNEDENKIIATLITKWQAADASNDVKLKQALQTELKEELTKAIDTSERLFNVIAGAFCPNLVKFISEIDEIDENSRFYIKLFNKLTELEGLLMSNTIGTATIADDSAYLALFEQSLTDLKKGLATFEPYGNDTLLPDELLNVLDDLMDLYEVVQVQADDVSILDSYTLNSLSSVELRTIIVTNSDIQERFETLCSKVDSLEQLALIDTGYEDAFKTLKLEDQLLADIRALDLNREFYYNGPVVASFAIDLNESTSALNTLMNPHTNYDINNVNNSFVISKLDIDFLDNGVQIARSSRIN